VKDIIRRAYVTKEIVGPDTTFLIVNLPDFQVEEGDGWKEGDEVEATIHIKKRFTR